MFCQRNWIAVVVIILSLGMFVPIAQAQRQELDLVICYSLTSNVVHSSSEMSVMGYEGKGIAQSTHANKLFDNNTLHFTGTLKIVDGKRTAHNFTKHMAPDGDIMIWEFNMDSESGMISKAIYGTGKWKGIKGESKGKVITKGKPIVPGTAQACEKWVGWI
jgi:hypothetical protein